VVDEGEAIDGITGVAAPILDFTGKVVAAVGVGFISSSEDPKGLKNIIKDVLITAQTISQELGYLNRKKVFRSSENRMELQRT
jgi:DNA-binding IclR family transcriptional regulator